MGFLTALFGRASNSKMEIADFIAGQSVTHDHVLLGEPHAGGSVLALYSFLAAHPEMFTKMAENGIRNFAVEFPNGFQDCFQQLAEGQISKDQFVREIEPGFETPWAGSAEYESLLLLELAGAVENAGKAGMKVFAADVTSNRFYYETLFNNSDLDNEVKQEYERVTGQIFPEPAGDNREKVQAALDVLSQEFKDTFRQRYEEVHRHILKRRLDDSDQHDYLLNHKAEGGVFGVVGVNHLQNVFGMDIPGIDDLLERSGGTVATLGVYANESAQKQLLVSVDDNKGRIFDGTDYNVILNSGIVYDKSGQVFSLSKVPSAFSADGRDSSVLEVRSPSNHFMPDL